MVRLKVGWRPAMSASKFYFNSTMVRLKARLKQISRFAVCDFNSTMVRLKAIRPASFTR